MGNLSPNMSLKQQILIISQFLVLKFCRGLVGWFWLRFSHEFVVGFQPGMLSSQGLLGLENPLPGWPTHIIGKSFMRLHVVCWQDVSVPQCLDLSRKLQECTNHSLAIPNNEWLMRKQDEDSNVFYDVNLGKKKPVISTTSHWLHRWSYVEWGRGLYLYVDTSQKGWLEVILGGSHYSYIPQKQPAQENLPLYFCVWRGFALLNPGAKSGWLNHLDRLAQLFNFIFFFFCGNASYTSDLGFIE